MELIKEQTGTAELNLAVLFEQGEVTPYATDPKKIEIALNATPPDIFDSIQIGLVRKRCLDSGIGEISAIADKYHAIKSAQSQSGVWCYDNYTDTGSNSHGLIKSDAHGGKRDCIVWPINHYLGLNRHPKVLTAAEVALKKYGTGCGTSAMSGGHCDLHKLLEQRLATWLGKEAALLFPTGYSANIGAISGLLKIPSTLVLFDRECHASIIDGVKLSGAKYMPFRHNDPEDLSRKLNRLSSQYKNVFVIVESVYSMSGEEAPLLDFCKLKEKHSFYLFVDEAHSFGLLPERTLTSKLGLTEQVDFVMTTLSKSTGSIGGVVATTRAFKTYLQVEANAYLFQAAIPPADAAAILAAMDVIEESPEIIASLWSKVAYMRTGLRQLGFDIGSGTSPIIPVYIRDSDTLLKMGQDMFYEGVFTTSVTYPVVKHSEVRFRFILNDSHSYDQIDSTLAVLEKLGRRYGILPSV